MGNDPGYSPGVTRADCFYLVDLLDFLDKISFGRPHTKPLLSANSICARIKKGQVRGFPDGAVVGSLPANAGDTGSSPGLGRSHMPRSN